MRTTKSSSRGMRTSPRYLYSENIGRANTHTSLTLRGVTIPHREYNSQYHEKYQQDRDETVKRFTNHEEELEKNIKQQSDINHASIRNAVTIVVDFYQNTFPVWAKRVAGLEGRARSLPLADISFLERAITRLTLFIDQLQETLQQLIPFTQCKEVISKWEKYANHSSDVLKSIEKSLISIRLSIIRILARTHNSANSATLERVFATQQANNYSNNNNNNNNNTKTTHSTFTKNMNTNETERRILLFNSRSLTPSYESSTGSRQSNTSIQDISTTRTTLHTSPNRLTPLRKRRTPRLSNSSHEGNSSRARSSSHNYINRYRNKQDKFQIKQQHSISNSPHQTLSWKEISNQYLSHSSKNIPPLPLAIPRCNEPFYEDELDSIQPRESYENNLLLYDEFNNRFTHYKNHNNVKHSLKLNNESYQRKSNILLPSYVNNSILNSNEHRILLEKIETMERSPFHIGEKEFKEAEFIFNKIYGTKSGPRQFSQWVDEMKFRALRHR